MADKPTVKGRGAILAQLLKKKQEEAAAAPGPPPEETVQPRCRGRALLLEKIREKKVAAGIAPPPSQQPDTIASPREVKEVTKKVEKLTVDVPTGSEAPPCSYKGTWGTPIKASANYIRLEVEKDRGMFEYEVRFRPDVDAKSNRFKLVNVALGDLAKTKVYDGDSFLYLPSQFYTGTNEFSLEMPTTGEPVTLLIKYKRQRRLGECLHLYNVLFKKIMFILLYSKMGRNYFNAEHKQIVPQHKLEILPGYAVSVDELEGGLMVCLDTQHRVIRTQTVYELIHEIIATNPSRFKEALQQCIIGSIVLTKYNHKTYIIDDIDYTMTPKDTFPVNGGGEISFIDYYKKQYNITIDDTEQPILISKVSKKMRKPGETEQMICLIPELCYLTGLSDAMRSDYKVMKDVALFTRVTPHQRMLALRKYLDNVKNSEKACTVLSEWGLKIADDTTEIQARVLKPETVFFGVDKSGKSVGTDWSKACGDNKVTGPVDLNNWIVFHTKRDDRNAESFVEIIKRLAGTMGCFISQPKIICLRDDRSDSYMASLKENLNEQVQVCVFIVPSLRADRYSVIKKVCCAQAAVASQVILSKTLSNPKKLRTIVHKIALQITCKLGGTLWSVEIPVPNWMVCGIDVYHGVGHQSVCGFVASINQTFTRWYSESLFQEHEIGDFFKLSFKRALIAKKNADGKFPDHIVIYRDGVGDGQLEHCRQHEITQFREVLDEMKLSTAITFIVIQKRISTRIYDMRGNNAENPPAGTIVDSDITRRNFYDFFLVPQSVLQGTVNPTHYIVLQNDAAIKPDHIQKLSYKLCHLYYNWSGTVRVPAPCQYAHKLAQLVGMYIKKEPCEALRKRLYYL